MSNIVNVNFTRRAIEESMFVADTAKDVLKNCKEFLDTYDYEEFLLAIMDNEYYDGADADIQHLVDIYFGKLYS